MDAGDLLSPSDVLDLAVLGVTSERARTAADVVAAVKEVGAARFQPVTDVILGRVGALAEAGLLSSARPTIRRARWCGVLPRWPGVPGAAAADAERRRPWMPWQRRAPA